MDEISRETHRITERSSGHPPEEPSGGSQSVRSSEEVANTHGAKGRRKVEVESP